MKKVIALIGSLRKESFNRQIFNNYKELTSGYFSLEEGNFDVFPLYNADIDTEPKPVVSLAKQIKESDGVIFFSPEYNFSIPGGLKNAFDWISRNNSKPFDNKAATVIGASPGNVGTARMQYHLRQVGVFLNLRFLNKPEIMIGKVVDKLQNGKLTDNDTIELLKRHIQQFAEFL